MHRSSNLTALVLASAALLVPAGLASAKDFCVAHGGCAAGDSFGTIPSALTAAKSLAGADRVLVGPGVYVGNLYTNDAVTIEGAGDSTVLTQNVFGIDAGSPSTLTLSGAGAGARNLHIALPGGAGPRGILLLAAASAEGVTIEGAGSTGAVGALLQQGSSFSGGSIDLPVGAIGAYAGPGGGSFESTTIKGGLTLRADAGANATLVRRSRLVGRGNDVVDAASGTLKIQDTLVDHSGSASGAAISSYASSAEAVHTVELRHVTLLGHGNDSFAGLDARAYAGSVSWSVRDSVVSNFGSNAIVRKGDGGTASLSLDHVDVFPAAPVKDSGLGATSQTAVTNTDPGFAADGFTPAPGSSLIDAASPGPIATGEPVLDLVGNPRMVAFGCGEARRDLGAVEAVGSCDVPQQVEPNIAPLPPPPAGDTAAPLVTKLRIAHRRAVRFTLSEAARATVRIKRAHRKALVLRRDVKGGSVSLKLKRTLRHGRYAIRVIAVDGAGNRSAPTLLRKRV